MGAASKVAMLGLLAGCYNAALVPCGDRVCPLDRVCAPSGDRCVAADQIDACAGRSEGASCSASVAPIGACHLGTCIPAGCGNGVIEPQLGEACDDGNQVPLDGCSANCKSDERCGNAIVDPGKGELCDCGDGTAGVPLGCTQANSDAPGAECRSDCHPSRCGDGVIDPTEWCDDANLKPGDGCRADCTGRFTPMASGTLSGLFGVWGASPTDVFAVGDRRILHYDGASWEPMAIPDPTRQYGVITGCGPADVYAIDALHVDHYDGVAWATSLTLPTAYGAWTGIACVGGAPIAVGTQSDGVTATGVIAQWTGGQWVLTAPPEWLGGIWGAAPDDLHVITTYPSYGVLHFDGVAWSPITVPGAQSLTQIWGTTATDIYLVGAASGALAVFHYDGATWSATPGLDVLYGLDERGIGGSPGDVLLVGSVGGDASLGMVARFDGVQWTLLPRPNSLKLWGVWGSASGRAFAVGDAGTILY